MNHPSNISAQDLAELMAAFNDVTAKLERTHDQLRREVTRLTQELSEANAQIERSRRLAALGEMAAGIAHEVRNPLGSIRLYARMLEHDLAALPKERGIAAKIAAATVALDAVVGDVLTFSREFRLDRRELAAGELIECALEACCHDGVGGWRGVRIEKSEALMNARVDADAGLLKQALVNVIRNAFEAMADCPGREHVLRVDIRRAHPAGYDGPVTVLSVADTGPGIGPEIAGRIFNPFFTTRQTGTGLGLAIVNRIADAHGGGVSIRNRSEAGAVQPGAVVELIVPDPGVSRVSPVPRLGLAVAGGGAGGSARVNAGKAA